ncbi:MAG: methyl-accepting chemotaxis protein [Bdellovibrionaceae bacterium]|nr:methyl-accepting chemotaxis protein [Pseudobdellovibrionaceae bacterium]NUM58252.1 hypothetical protein [Pseudobdellovibrionaceae bacterium]
MKNLNRVLYVSLFITFFLIVYLKVQSSHLDSWITLVIFAGLLLNSFFTILILFLVSRIQKNIKDSIADIREAASKVAKASLLLSHQSQKQKQSSESISVLFHESLKALNEINQLSAKNKSETFEANTEIIEGKNSALESRTTLEKVQNEIQNLVNDSEKIQEITSFIDDISFKTNLLSLNAAVEAARAGEHGKGFAVVADAVRDLAQQSSSSTKKIRDIIDNVVDKSKKSANHLEESHLQIQNMISHIDLSVKRSGLILDSSESQLLQLNTANDSLHNIESESLNNENLAKKTSDISKQLSQQASVFEEKILNLSELTGIEFETLKHLNYLQKARILAADCAKIISTEIQKNEFTLSELLEFNYIEIKDFNIKSLGYLFDVSKVPLSGFSPKKYFTNYDSKIDLKLQPLFDNFLKDNSEFLFALPVDLNAYAPIHNAKFCKAWTNDPQKDLIGNRVKRFFNDNMTFLKNTRVGLLSDDSKIPSFIDSRSQLRELNCQLHQNRMSEKKYLIQTYLRDTGEIATNLSVPIFVFGERYGTVVVCWVENH